MDHLLKNQKKCGRHIILWRHTFFDSLEDDPRRFHNLTIVTSGEIFNEKFRSIYVTGDKDEVVYLLPATVVVSARQYNNEDRVSITTLTIQR